MHTYKRALSNALRRPFLPSRRTTGAEFVQPVAHTGDQSGQAGIEFLKHLASVVISASAHHGGFLFRLLQQAGPFCLDRLQQSAFLEHLLHPCLRLGDEPFLLLHDTPRPLVLFGDGDAHPIDNIEDTLFIYQEPAAERHAPSFCEHVFQFIDQIVKLDGAHPLCANFCRSATTICGGTNSTGSRPIPAISRTALELIWA